MDSRKQMEKKLGKDAGSKPLFMLVITRDGAKVDEVIAKHDLISIGRRADNDIRLDDQSISSQHAQFSYTGHKAYIEDLDSTNGTYINGRRVKFQAVEDGDIVVIGKHKMVYRNLAGTEEMDTPATEFLEDAELKRMLATSDRVRITPLSDTGKKVLNWIAQDPRGIWWGFENEPLPEESGWTDTQNGVCIQLKEDKNPLSNWRDTLRKI